MVEAKSQPTKKLKDKIYTWAIRIILVVILIYSLDGGWKWRGIGGVFLTIAIILGIRIYKQKEGWKTYYHFAKDLGKQSKKKEE